MISVFYTDAHSTVVFAAQELKRYLRMMMPEAGEIPVAYDPAAKSGIRVGVMSSFGLDASDVADGELDEVLYADVTGSSGVIAGNNPRAVLLAVYEYLRRNGCRWLMPGKEGELIPQRSICDVSFRHKPSRRYRGWCNEGAMSQDVILDMIDFTPKVGMNLCMLQFRVPAVFYERYYNHCHNAENRLPEHISREQVLQWTRECESEISKRSLQLHAIGHGFTIDPFGIDSANTWSQIEDSEIPEDTKEFLALVNGKRGLFRGIPANTNFCMSNPVARKRVADYIADYAQMHQNTDAIHVWLADDYNNHCECDACRQKTPSDWYMILMNEIDEALNERRLSTRIVFIAYVNTCWAPLVERIRNSDRFVLLLAPITRNYVYTLPKEGSTAHTTPYVPNGISMPQSLDEYLAYFEDWKKTWKGANLCYEYHFWRHRIYDPSGLALAKRIYEDIGAYTDALVDGLIQCGSQRSFFPNGFAYYVHARRLYDMSVPYEVLLEDYFTHAYGEDAQEVLAYFQTIEDCIDVAFTEGKKSIDSHKGAYYCPSEADRILRAKEATVRAQELSQKAQTASTRLQSVSKKLLRYHAEYVCGLVPILAAKAVGDTEGARAALERFRLEFGKCEEQIEAYYDHFLAMDALLRITNESIDCF